MTEAERKKIAEELVDLGLIAAKKFLAGEAGIIIVDTPRGKCITFGAFPQKDDAK